MLDAQDKIAGTGAAGLIERVQKHQGVREIVHAIADGRRHIHVSGLAGASAAFLIEALRGRLERPVVVCCIDQEQADDVRSDLRTISAARIFRFPEKDIFPQRFELHENLSVRGERSLCLDAIIQERVDVVVTSFLGFLEKTIPAGVFRTSTRTFDLHQTLDLDELQHHLVAVGYQRSHAVEEIGQFAIRGALVDLFDPSRDSPSRIELLDDEIVSVRSFDIDSQRSINELQSIRVLPATGILVTEGSLDLLSDHLARNGVRREIVSQIRSEIEHHPISYLLRRYAPSMGMDGALLDYFDEPPVLVFWDERGVGGVLDSLGHEIEALKKRTPEEYPLLDLHDYLHPPEHYTFYDGIITVHRWETAPPSAGNGQGAGTGENSGGPQPEPRPPRDVVQFHTAPHPSVLGKLDTLVETIRRLRRKGVNVYIYSESAAQRERLAEMLEEDEELVHLPVGWLSSGFVWEEATLAVLTDHEIFHRILPRPTALKRTRRVQSPLHDHLQIADYVVHVDYGVGRYLGLQKVDVDDRETECLSIRYADGDRIFVPLEQMHLVEKYVGKEGVVPRIDRLGSARWQRTKKKTQKALEEVARELIELYAVREVAQGYAFSPDSLWQKELEASFPFEETPDQLKATEEIKRDMESPTPMDRLVCGDVGFGKTEVAVRSAFKSVHEGKQVAILVPTTILAMQHYETFKERVAPFPVRVEMLSRFKSPAEQRAVVAGVKAGVVDIVIGTHRLLSTDISFENIGLLIVDEEHRFGVRSKEKLKRFKNAVDVLTLTATPIPRTLHMSLAGMRRISVIETPPRNRHPVKTQVIPFDEETIVQAIQREIARAGQVFFVHNRIDTISSMQALLERLLPNVRFGIAHGRMSERKLEKSILAFIDGKYDVLISTTIIESGLDFANVNTLIVNGADRFGLAELYQLRGRVGRRERQAYAFLMVPRGASLPENALKRLEAMEEFEDLGSGYQLAMRDLQIRGAGNVLGLEQHGTMAAVGFDLYCKMLKEAVEKIKGVRQEQRPQSRVECSIRSYLPDDYLEDQNERMGLYKRLAGFADPADVDGFLEELVDRFGDPPPEALNLIDIARIKLQSSALGASLVRLKRDRIGVEFHPGKSLPPQLCAELVETFQGRVLFKSGNTFGLTLTLPHGCYVLAEAKKLLRAAYFYDKKSSYPS
jgi:transcription-repair coupling factor (superfamily II helicase)